MTGFANNMNSLYDPSMPGRNPIPEWLRARLKAWYGRTVALFTPFAL